MRHLVSVLALIFFSSADCYAQNTTTKCGSDKVRERELEENQLFQRKLFNLERRLIQNREADRELRDGDICVIPTVVHIIHEGEEIGTSSNISTAQIHSAIAALNEDFRKAAGSNGDGDGADVGIEFCLAMRDPDGNSTTGINRVDGSSVPNYAEEGISIGQDFGADEQDIKSLSIWPKEDYLNIWIVNEIENNDADSGIQGFAYFPTSSMVDGVTILFNSFGTEGNLKSYTNLNRTTTHEVGHFLGLYHTFHGSSDCNETDCSSQGDRVCDTPVTVLNSSCNNPECNDSQQVENYMDYTGQSCKNMFTEGQKVRMRFTLFEERGSLLESLGCVPASTSDIGISSIASPVGSLCSGTLFPTVSFTNYGAATITSAQILYQIDNGAEQTFNWTGSLASGETTEVVLPTITTANGNHTFYASTSSPNGNEDEFSSNDGDHSDFIVTSGATATINITMDYMGSETTWEITQNGNLMSSGGPYTDNTPGLVSHEVCLAAGCYDFTIYDEYGDGMAFLSGNYEVLDGDGNQVVFGQNNWGDSETSSFCMTAVQGDPPVTNFSASQNLICAGESVNFNDSSTGNPQGWSWTFDGGSISSSSSQNPSSVVFATPGTYNVTLTSSNGFGSDSETQTIEVQAAPTISLTSENISCNGLDDGTASVNASSGATISWSSGGSASEIQNLSAGTYSVSAVSSAGCTATSSFTISEPSALGVTLFKSDVTCFNSADGSITSSVIGGTLPHTNSWSNGAESTSLSGLSQGVYTLTVTDANGCTDSENVAIVEPSEITVNVNDITPETCVGADGSATANALGGTGTLTYSWSNEQTGQSLADVSFGIHEITVTDAMGCTGSATIEIPYDCETILPTTQLVASQCNKTGFAMNENLLCNALPGVEMYLWNFTDLSGTLIEEAYTIGNNNSFSLTEIDHLSYGDVLNVKIKVQKDQEWGEWGNTCTINMLTSPPAISIIEVDCNLEYLAEGETIQAEINTGADEYEWSISWADQSYVYSTFIDQLTITSDMNLPISEPFEIKLRGRYGDDWSDYGNGCSYSYEFVDYVEGVEIENIWMNIYPNPSNGKNFSLIMDNLPGGTYVIDVETFDSNGRLVKAWKYDSNGNTQISETYSFDNKLSRGMYLVQVGFAGQQFQQKLIVR